MSGAQVKSGASRGEERFNAFFPFPLQHSEGGLTAVFTREAKSSRGDRITFVTTDSEKFNLEAASVLPADASMWSEADNGQLFGKWFGANWTRLFIEASLVEMQHEGVAEALFQREDCSHEFGSLPYILEYSERHSPSSDIERKFADRFDKQVERILDEQRRNPEVQQVLNWQDACWYWAAIDKNAGRLREAGVFQTLHIHTSISPFLDQSEWGREVLKSMTLVDKLFLHSYRDIYNIERQFTANGFKAPEMDIYRLGIDTNAIEKSIVSVNAGNYALGGIPNFGALSEAQKELIHRCFEAQQCGYVSFIIPERMEVTKGTLTVYKAVEEALSRMNEETRNKVRFFFLQELRALHAENPFDPKVQYLDLLRREDARIKERFPGNVFFAESLKQRHRVALFALERGASFIGGGNAEGLGLASLENAWVNRDSDTAVISGTGSGWAQEALREGFKDGFFGVQPGDVNDFAQKILDVVRIKSEAPGTLRNQKGKLANEWIPSRQDSVLVGKSSV